MPYERCSKCTTPITCDASMKCLSFLQPKKRGQRIYIIGSLRSERIQEVAKEFRDAFPDMEVFDDWHAAGFEADDYWKKYEQGRGRSYLEALQGYAAKNVFQFDKKHIDAADYVVLVLPAGRSGHLELGYSIGAGKKGYILLDNDSDRWDVMYQFATGLAYDVNDIILAIKGEENGR